jgi:hypothetical protein
MPRPAAKPHSLRSSELLGDGNMRRRDFITLLGGAAVAWPLAANAQQTTIPRAGVLRPIESAPHGSVEELKGGLQELGYNDGRNSLRSRPNWSASMSPESRSAVSDSSILELGRRGQLRLHRACPEVSPLPQSYLAQFGAPSRR